MPQIIFKKYDESLKQTWEEINKSAPSTFLTSIDWIEFQKSLGKEIGQYLIYADEQPVGNFYIEIFRRRIARFAYSPYGPVIRARDERQEMKDTPEDLEPKTSYSFLLSSLFQPIINFQKHYITSHNLNLFRIDPLINKENLNTFFELGYVRSMAPTQAKDVWEIDLQQSEDELLADMKKVARYNIKSSQKQGIIVERIDNLDKVKVFADILEETTKRHGFSSFNYGYFKKQFEALHSQGMCEIFLAKLGDTYVSGALVNIYNNKGYYSHGGSLTHPEAQKYGASYLLHWEIMKYMRNLGKEKYNMWGVLPTEELKIKNDQKSDEGQLKTENYLPTGQAGKLKTHPMAGVSEFKKRFGGYEINYVGGLDIANPGRKLQYYLQRLSDWWSYRKDRY